MVESELRAERDRILHRNNAQEIAIDAASAAVDGIAAEAMRPHRDLVVGIAVKPVMADLMGGRRVMVAIW